MHICIGFLVPYVERKGRYSSDEIACHYLLAVIIFQIGRTVLFILDNFKTVNNSARNQERAVEICLNFFLYFVYY